ncbi:hypothetical protein PC116_g649 [Phytophthora cactorum]|nr:hypothetical protein PC116_g649 [Phytophthora cactorum]
MKFVPPTVTVTVFTVRSGTPGSWQLLSKSSADALEASRVALSGINGDHGCRDA